MGTNVDAILKNIDNNLDYGKLEELARLHDINGIRKWLEEKETIISNNTIHIGKRSCGWKFLFNHNNWKYYGHTRESIDNFLRGCYEIRNEYGDIFTVDEFWEEFVDSCKNGICGEEYANIELENAIKCENGEIDNKFGFYLTVEQAKQNKRDAEYHNYYEEKYDENGKEIDYSKLDYRFSDSTEFC